MEARNTQKGFTLVEMIVAVGLFAIVMLICVAALLSLVDANKKAQALQSVMNNLNVAIDGMVRSVRMGTDYHCGASGVSVSGMLPADCAYPGDTFFAFEPFHDCTDPNTVCDSAGNVPPTLYWYQVDTIGGKSVGRLYRSTDGTESSGIAITAPEVSIDSVKFFVTGSCPARAGYSCAPDDVQPKILMDIEGSAGATKVTIHTTFHIQATAVQRVLDI
jgi:prepilin-type N-terminal cleavage/methylation domain-containing protein